MARVIFLAALFAAGGAQNPDVPFGGGSCTSDWDCSLGGTCSAAHTCECDIWFTGPTCTYLNLAPAASANQGLQIANYFSWGGHCARDDSTGLYHGYFSFMCNHATLSSWTTASSIVHAVAQQPEGPYAMWNGTQGSSFNVSPPVVVPPWAHNAILHQSASEWQIWHIGNGQVDPNKWYPCYNASETTPEWAAAHAQQQVGREGEDDHVPRRVGDAAYGDVTYVETAPSLLGPWTSFANNSGVPINVSTPPWFSSMSNPTPYTLPNGTTLLFHSATTCPPGWGALAPNCIGMMRSDSWQGPFTEVLDTPITHPEGEDPFVWQDPRGNFHMLTNVNTYHARCGSGVPCGGHAWSQDGITWSNQSVGAFGPVIRFTNGTYWYNAYVERPQIYFENGVPRTFFTGMGRSSYVDSVSWAQAFCSPGVQGCGPTIPPPPTIVQFSQGGLCLQTNASASFPCTGGHGDSCPVFLGSCDAPTASWTESGNVIANAAVTAAINLDCDNCAPGTVAKAYAGPGSNVNFNNATGQLVYTCGTKSQGAGTMCLNGGQTTPVPPCEGGEFYMQTQIQLDDCSAADTQGWTRTVVS